MKRNWSPDELLEHFGLIPVEKQLIGNKTGASRLGFTVLLKYFQYEARFPHKKQDIPPIVIEFIAEQLDLPPDLFEEYRWGGSERNFTYHRKQIREFFGFREIQAKDKERLKIWLKEQVHFSHDTNDLITKVYSLFRKWKIEPPSSGSLARMIDSAIHIFEKTFFQETYQQLSQTTCSRLDALLESTFEEENDGWIEEKKEDIFSFRYLLSSHNKPSVNTMKEEIKKLLAIRHLQIPDSLCKQVTPKILKIYRLRAATETVTELRAHPPYIRYSLLAILFWHCLAEVTDHLADLIDEVTRKLGNKAEKKIKIEVVKDLQKVEGKNKHIIDLLEAAITHPEGVIQDILCPVVNPETIRNIIREMKRNKREYREKNYTKMHTSYQGHYRSSFCDMLKHLDFHSNNQNHQPVIEAIQLIRDYEGSGQRYFALSDEVPIEGVIQPKWKEILIETDSKGEERVNRVNYEIAVLQSLRKRLRCKEIWIEGADRYRNPEEDLPQDFEEHKEEHFQALKIPLDVELFISKIKDLMKDSLSLLNQGFEEKSNSKVVITTKNNKGWMKVTPLEKQEEPQHLVYIKNHIKKRWSDINLLDILKETDFHTHFTEHFKSTADRQILDPETIQRRLLLCLFGLGTNTGLKAVSAGSSTDSYRELRYLRYNFIHKEHLRKANAEVVNQIILYRLKEVWGDATTAFLSTHLKNFLRLPIC